MTTQKMSKTDYDIGVVIHYTTSFWRLNIFFKYDVFWKIKTTRESIYLFYLPLFYEHSWWLMFWIIHANCSICGKLNLNVTNWHQNQNQMKRYTLVLPHYVLSYHRRDGSALIPTKLCNDMWSGKFTEMIMRNNSWTFGCCVLN